MVPVFELGQKSGLQYVGPGPKVDKFNLLVLKGFESRNLAWPNSKMRFIAVLCALRISFWSLWYFSVPF